MNKVITTIIMLLLVMMTADRSYSAEEEFVCNGIMYWDEQNVQWAGI